MNWSNQSLNFKTSLYGDALCRRDTLIRLLWGQTGSLTKFLKLLPRAREDGVGLKSNLWHTEIFVKSHEDTILTTWNWAFPPWANGSRTDFKWLGMLWYVSSHHKFCSCWKTILFEWGSDRVRDFLFSLQWKNLTLLVPTVGEPSMDIDSNG